MLEKDSNLTKLAIQLKKLVRAAYELAPLAVVFIFLIAFVLIFFTVKSTGLMVAVLLLLVVVFALIVFIKTRNYGEAALSLAAGLFSVYTVDWNAGNFIGFVISWIGFSVLALLVSSIQIAAKVEDIYRQAALRLAPNPPAENYKPFESQLKSISKKDYPFLGPVERAQTLLYFSFRQVPLETME